MPDYKLGFKSPYIEALDFLGGKSATVKITKVVLEQIPDMKDPQKKRDRWVVSFAGKDRTWILNRTNAEILVGLWGKDTENWVGHSISLRAEQVDCGGETKDGVRIFGSPELTEPHPVKVKLPRKRPIEIVIVPTGKPAPSPGAS